MSSVNHVQHHSSELFFFMFRVCLFLLRKSSCELTFIPNDRQSEEVYVSAFFLINKNKYWIKNKEMLKITLDLTIKH